MNLEPTLITLWSDLHEAHILWQVAVLFVSLGAAWAVSRTLQRVSDPNISWRVGAGGLRRVRFPIAALILVLVGRAVLRHYQSVSLLDLAVPLLAALAIARAVVYMLRLSFREGSLLYASERLIAWLIWLGFALHITGLAPDLLAYLEDIRLPLGKQSVSLLSVLQGLLSVAVALLLGLWLASITEERLQNAHALDVNLRAMLSKVLRPLLVLCAMLLVLPAVGIDLTALSVFGGALGVGIGFGLQKIASNYISGFIILLDRSIAIGNWLTVDTHTGQVAQLTARYVVLRKGDGTEALIPNDTLITSTVVNYSYSDNLVQVSLTLQISYRSDLDRALQLMTEVAAAQPRVLAEPAPAATVSAFADNGMQLELGVWIDGPMGKGVLLSQLYQELWKSFRAHGIELPSPQREIRIVPPADGTGGGTALN